MKTKSLLIIASFLFLFSCIKKDVNSMPKTTLEFEHPHRRYNPILLGESLNISYKVTNTGKKPLLISEVQTSCSCVVTERTKKRIGIGDHGYINLKYDSKKNIGYVKQYVTIIANVDSTLTKNISFELNVVPDSDYRKDYEEIYFSENEINNYSKNYVPVPN